MEIVRSYYFDAAHSLGGLAQGHPCARLHGHRFRFDLTLSGPLDDRSMVMDFRDLDVAVAPLLERLDHGHLNEIEGLEQPTAERIANWIAGQLDLSPVELVEVRVWESDRACAVWRRG